jgi:hypothetical protein
MSRSTRSVCGVKLTVDRPHSRKECGKGLVKRAREFLETIGKRPDGKPYEGKKQP